MAREAATVEAARIRGESSYRKELLDQTGALDEIRLQTLGKSLLGKEERLADLEELRVKRVDAINKQVSNYYTSRDSGSAAQRLRTLLGLYTASVENQTDFARAAFRPDLALIDMITRNIPDYNKPGVDRKAYAKEAWASFASLAKAQGAGAAGTYDWMVETFGNPSDAGFTPSDKLFSELSELSQMRDRAFREANEFQAKARGYDASFQKWAEQNGVDPKDPTSVDRYVAENKLSVKDIPLPSSSYVEGLASVSKNPDSQPLYFSDIDPVIESRKKGVEAAKKEFEGFRGMRAEEEEAPPVEPDLTERERLVGWLQQEDTRDWAQSHGFRLGTVREPTAKELADIEAGKLPRDYLVKGMVYNPSPDDLQAAAFAKKQQKMKPQEDVLYRLGLRGDRTRRGTAEITVQTKPAIPGKPVRALKTVTFGGATYAVGSDGKFYNSRDDGNTWDPVEASVGKDAFAAGQEVPLEGQQPELPGVSTPETPAETKTYTIEEQGWIYGRDLGTATGIDRTPGSPTFGQRVSFPKERVVSRERIGLERVRPTLAEKMDLRLAQRREAKRQAEERELIGPKASRAAVRERAETAKRMRELPAAVSTEPGELLEEKGITGPIESPAIRMLPEEAKDEQIAEAERLSVPVTRSPEIFEQRPQPIPLQKLTTSEARANIGFIRDASKALAKREAEGTPVAATQPEQMPGSGLSSQEAAFAASMRRRKAPPVPLP